MKNKTLWCLAAAFMLQTSLTHAAKPSAASKAYARKNVEKGKKALAADARVQEISSLLENDTSYDVRIGELTTNIAEQEELYEALQEEFEDAKANGDDEGELGAYSTQMAESNDAIADMRKQLDNLKMEKERKLDEARQLEILNESNQKASLEAKKLQNLIAKNHQELTDLDAAVVSETKAGEQLRVKGESLQRQVNQRQAELSAAQEGLRREEAENERLRRVADDITGAAESIKTLANAHTAPVA